ncbi:Alpha/Beta hydrolase protein [Mycena pura]|uniref:Alpha/Beta hydrolase protein n=1 Tax=Mycena pura TaxID=153505 RepID=A0AAD6YDL5_9AGAR|nr:Alpha/Beta hydrolase protein [Mycena pura]
MSDPVLAAPSGACCLSGFPHQGTPQGTFTSVAGVKTYIARPPTPAHWQQRRVILYFPDVWGIDIFLNGQLLCDYFASQGFLVLAMDYFRGDPIMLHRIEPGFDFEGWKVKHKAFAAGAVPEWIDAVKTQFGTPETKYAAVGYCFGAPYVMDALSETSSAVCVGAFGHPAFLNESHFTNCARAASLPVLRGDGPHVPRHRAEELLGAGACTFHVQLFSGVGHGFCLRGDMTDPYRRFVKEESASGIVRWFTKFIIRLLIKLRRSLVRLLIKLRRSLGGPFL